MSVTFWILMLAMLFLAIGLIVLPLVRTSATSSVAYKESNLSIYNSKLQELEKDLEEDRINKEHYMSAVAELDHELLVDVPNESLENAADNYGVVAKPQPVLAMVVAVFLPAFVFLVYMQLGMHANEDMAASEELVQEEHQESIVVLIRKLADKLNTSGGSGEEWAMLGRAYKQIKRYAESSSAFEQAIKIKPSVRLYLEQAEALALLNGQSFIGKPRDLVMQAYELDPNNVNVIWFAGVAEFQSGHYGESIDLLVRLAPEAKEDASIDQSLRYYLSEARAKLIADGVDVAPVDELLNTTQGEPAATAALASLEVEVNINSEIRQLFEPNTVVFVYAKAQQGPKMPLAAQRIRLSDLPATIVLDDSMAMVQGMNMSAFSSVEVSARVSRAGSAIAQSGDYIGSVLVDDVSNADKLNVVINKIVK